jgi:hypothetical protein
VARVIPIVSSINRCHDLDAQAREPVLYRTPFGRKALEISQSFDDPGHHRLEQRLLPWEVSIDGRLARRRRLGDLIETCALVTSLEEYPLGRIENPRFDIARPGLSAVFPDAAVSNHSACSPFGFTLHSRCREHRARW